MKIYCVNLFAAWEFNNYKLFLKLEDAEKFQQEHNDMMQDSCLKDECCFARIEEKDVQ